MYIGSYVVIIINKKVQCKILGCSLVLRSLVKLDYSKRKEAKSAEVLDVLKSPFIFQCKSFTFQLSFLNTLLAFYLLLRNLFTSFFASRKQFNTFCQS